MRRGYKRECNGDATGDAMAMRRRCEIGCNGDAREDAMAMRRSESTIENAMHRMNPYSGSRLVLNKWTPIKISESFGRQESDISATVF